MPFKTKIETKAATPPPTPKKTHSKSKITKMYRMPRVWDAVDNSQTSLFSLEPFFYHIRGSNEN